MTFFIITIPFDSKPFFSDDVLSDLADLTIFKLYKKTEIYFYKLAIIHFKFSVFILLFTSLLSFGSNLNLVIEIIATAVAISQLSNINQLFIINQISESVFKRNIWFFSSDKKIKTKIAIIFKNISNYYTKPNILDVKLEAQL